MEDFWPSLGKEMSSKKRSPLLAKKMGKETSAMETAKCLHVAILAFT